MGIRHKRSQAARGFLNAYTAQHVREVVGVLGVSAIPECQSFENQKGARSADPDVPDGLFKVWGWSGDPDFSPVDEGKVKAGRDNRSECGLKIS